MKNDFTHIPTRTNFMSENPTIDDVNEFSNEIHVNGNIPKTFTALSSDDAIVPPISTIKYCSELMKNEVKCALYMFPTGGHGWCFDSDFIYLDECKDLLKKWLL